MATFIQSTETLPAPLIATLTRFKPILVQGLRGSTGSLNDVSDRCACGAAVYFYRPLPKGDIRVLCQRHAPRWAGGCALADLAGSLGPKIHFTIHASADTDGDLDHLRELFRLLDQRPGGNVISIRIVTLDGLATYFERTALASKTIRVELATRIRDRALRRANAHRETQPQREARRMGDRPSDRPA